MAVRARASLGNDHRLVCQILDREALTLGERMPLRNGDDGRLVKQQEKLDALVGDLRRTDERQIKAAGQQTRQQPDRLILDKLDGDVGPPLAEIMEYEGDQTGSGAVDCADSQRRRLRSCARAVQFSLAREVRSRNTSLCGFAGPKTSLPRQGKV